MDAGTHSDTRQARTTTLRQALERYRDTVAARKLHPYQENQRISRWMKHELSTKTLADLRGKDFAEYRDARRDNGRAENTIRLELQLISHLFELARKEWGFEGLQNPLKNIRKPSGARSRDRRLRQGEFDLLHALLSGSENRWAAPAFELAIETSLRKGTLFALRWEWIDLPSRFVRFPTDARGAENKGVPAVLPLSARAVAVLRHLAALAEGMSRMNAASLSVGPIDVAPSKLRGLVFRTTANAVGCVWKRALKHAKARGKEVGDLRWHDLRHEATSRLFEKGLHPLEVASMTGHRSMQMLKRYTHLNPADILTKL